jgi:hypothetical protein
MNLLGECQRAQHEGPHSDDLGDSGDVDCTLR